ncbi:MAG TPA: T9SS type A sorting domain-containing protein [Flavipsychrobacter sp.]|nr:T9SS type A sorting domain-containing protein [Flavipsychrobacter sp.]
MQLNGTDAESGVAKYRLHVKTDTSAWLNFGIVNSDSVRIIGQRGKTYHFYVSALDHVGNVESKTPTSEASVTVPLENNPNPNPGGSENYNVYPNPTTGQLFIQSVKDISGATMIITDVTGRIIRTAAFDLKAGAAQSIDLSGLSNGVYLIALTKSGMQDETFKILLAKPER